MNLGRRRQAFLPVGDVAEQAQFQSDSLDSTVKHCHRQECAVLATIPMISLINYERRESFAIVRLNRPEKLNALSREMIAELTDIFAKTANDHGLARHYPHRRRRSGFLGRH